MADTRVLLVDDDEVVRESMTLVLEHSGFMVTSAGNVPDALKYISSESYDVLLSDLHMPGAGDGLTVVSAMRHANPSAVTLLLSAFPEMSAAAQAILRQADEVLVKPMDVTSLVDVIKQRVASGPERTREIETVAKILGRATENIIREWYRRVQGEAELMSIRMSAEQRCSHLPAVLSELVNRLRSKRPIGTKVVESSHAAIHGINRFKQGYTAAMLVEESRILQASIFQTLQNNLANIDYSVLLTEVMTIADEIDFQLSQAVARYTRESFDAARA
jgi:YesN/AraC family two-component response regulator